MIDLEKDLGVLFGGNVTSGKVVVTMTAAGAVGHDDILKAAPSNATSDVQNTYSYIASKLKKRSTTRSLTQRMSR